MLKSWLALPTTQTIDKPTCRGNSILVGLTNYQHWSSYNQDEALCKKYNYDLRTYHHKGSSYSSNKKGAKVIKGKIRHTQACMHMNTRYVTFYMYVKWINVLPRVISSWNFAIPTMPGSCLIIEPNIAATLYTTRLSNITTWI